MYHKPDLSDCSDIELTEAMRRGNSQAFDTVYRRHHRLLYTLAYRYLNNREDAEDAVADIFTHFWEKRRDLIVESSLKNYLYTMLKNHILNLWRKQTPIFADYNEAMQKEDEDSFEKMMDNEEQRRILYEAIDSLPEQKRRICLLKLEGDLKNEQIANSLNISINTFKTHYLQALRMLRVIFQRVLILMIAITQINLFSVNV